MGMAKAAASKGQRIQVETILVSECISVTEPLNIFHPTMAPTMAWEVETGKRARVIKYTLIAAAKATIKAPATALTAPSFPRV